MKKLIIATIIFLAFNLSSNEAVTAEVALSKEASQKIKVDFIQTYKKSRLPKVVKYLTTKANKTSYVFSGSTPKGWDCSGMVRWTYKQIGITLPHSANKQAHIGCRVSGEGWGTRTNSPETKQVYGDYAYIKTQAHDLGRWPANFIHDGSEEVVGLFPHTKAGVAIRGRSGGKTCHSNQEKPPMADMGYADGGSAARFFYCAKASKSDRDEGCEGLEERQKDESRKEGNVGGDNPRNRGVNLRTNHHPTVKPTDLMRYLCRLVTPPGGTVLDPFMGSGSTGKAAVLEGFSFIGIEREAEYIAIAEARINHATND